MPRFSTPEEQKRYVDDAIATLGALFGQAPEPIAVDSPLIPVVETKELTCFCGNPPTKLLVSDDELDELVICEVCYAALTTGYSIRATVQFSKAASIDMAGAR